VTLIQHEVVTYGANKTNLQLTPELILISNTNSGKDGTLLKPNTTAYDELPDNRTTFIRRHCFIVLHRQAMRLPRGNLRQVAGLNSLKSLTSLDPVSLGKEKQHIFVAQQLCQNQLTPQEGCVAQTINLQSNA
jgi:hypothetical protein